MLLNAACQMSKDALAASCCTCDVWSQGELAIKNTDLAAATKEAEKLLKEISENTAIAEKEKQKVCISDDFGLL